MTQLSTSIRNMANWQCRYHKQHGHQNQQLHENGDGTFSIVNPETSAPYPGETGMEKEKPHKCEYCHKRYKNLNGLKYVRSARLNTDVQRSTDTFAAQAAFDALRDSSTSSEPEGRHGQWPDAGFYQLESWLAWYRRGYADVSGVYGCFTFDVLALGRLRFTV
jgi:hypothetical protein